MDNVLRPPNKAPKQPCFEIEFDFAGVYHLDINVHQVSNNARLAVTANDAEVFNHYFIASDNGLGDWVHIEWNEERNVYESISNRDYRAVIPAGTGKVVVMVTDGDWLSVNGLRFTAAEGEHAFDVMPNMHMVSRPGVYAPIEMKDDDVYDEGMPEIEPELVVSDEDSLVPEADVSDEDLVETEPVILDDGLPELELIIADEDLPQPEPTEEPQQASEPKPISEPEPLPVYISELDLEPLPNPELIPQSESEPLPKPEPIPAVIPAPKPRAGTPPEQKSNPWLVGAAASIIAVAAIALAKTRRRRK